MTDALISLMISRQEELRSTLPSVKHMASVAVRHTDSVEQDGGRLTELDDDRTDTRIQVIRPNPDVKAPVIVMATAMSTNSTITTRVCLEPEPEPKLEV